MTSTLSFLIILFQIGKNFMSHVDVYKGREGDRLM